MCHFVAKYKILLYNKICLNVSERSTIHGLFSFVTLLYSFFKIVEGIYVYIYIIIYNYIYTVYIHTRTHKIFKNFPNMDAAGGISPTQKWGTSYY